MSSSAFSVYHRGIFVKVSQFVPHIIFSYNQTYATKNDSW